MGLISQTLKRSKDTHTNDDSNITPIVEESSAPDTTPSQPAKEIDWEERHFQICLALLGNPEFTSRLSIPYPKIINHADRMIKALKQHHAEQ